MKSILWEGTPGATVALINSGQFVLARLYTIALFGSQGTIKFTDAGVDIGYLTNRFSSTGPRIDTQASKTKAHWKRGLDVDQWMIVFAPRLTDPVTGAAYPDKIGSTPWIAAARAGALDGADIQVDQAYFPSWPNPAVAPLTPTGVITIFAGQPAEVDTSDTLVVLTINDYRDLLTMKLPRNLFQAGCRHTLFDPGCTLNPTSFRIAGMTVAAGSTQSVLLENSLQVPPGSATFTLGKIVMTSGLNNGFSRGVRQWFKGNFQLTVPLPFTVSPGDTFDGYAGCDKQSTTCTAFGNLVNFGGEPDVPDATTAI